MIVNNLFLNLRRVFLSKRMNEVVRQTTVKCNHDTTRNTFAQAINLSSHVSHNKQTLPVVGSFLRNAALTFIFLALLSDLEIKSN